MVLESEENTSEWRDSSERRRSRTETRSSVRKLQLKECKNSEFVPEGFNWGKHCCHTLSGNLPLRSCMELQMDIWAESQAVNADIPMNRGSGAAMTRYKSCNHDRAAARAGIKYRMAVIGSECDEVWYEEISRNELTDRVMQDWIIFCRDKFFFHILRKMQSLTHRSSLFLSCTVTYKMIFSQQAVAACAYLTQGSVERRRRSTSHDFLPERSWQRTHTCHQQTRCQSSSSSGCCPYTPSVLTHPSPCTWLCRICVKRR